MSIHVVIVDDHSSVRVGMKYIVYEWMPKSHVSLVDDMQELLHVLTSGKPVDIVILDIDIPGGNNLQMIKTIRDVQKDVRILMHSASDELVYALRYIDLGADGYLQKDSDESEIKAALDTVLHGKKYLSPGLKDSLLQSRLNLGSVGTANPLDDFSNRELEVCRLLAQGKGVTEVAEALFIHTSTVGTYKAKIYDKLGVRNVKELIDKFRLYEVT
ncbi:response regulator [Parapedobacter deserti]|uniref:Response regulator n=1 Tax=Parapedobacter deserti TaxID=1912957 RepID=A0ABV7JF11_9SPHI